MMLTFQMTLGIIIDGIDAKRKHFVATVPAHFTSEIIIFYIVSLCGIHIKLCDRLILQVISEIFPSPHYTSKGLTLITQNIL